MNIEEYNQFVLDFRLTGDVQANNKRIEYTESRGDDDVLANFKSTAFDLDLDTLQVLGIFMKKHWSSIINYIKTGKVYSDEDVISRIQDMHQYLELTAAAITEKRELAALADEEETAEDQVFNPHIINKKTIREGVQS